MSRPGLLLLATAALGLAAAGTPATSPEAARILERADRARSAWPEAVFRLRVTVSRPGEEGKPGLFAASVKGSRLRIDFLDPADEGKAYIETGEEGWLLMPRTKSPIKVPRSQRVTGAFSTAELLRTRFADEYDAVVERSEEIGGRAADVVRLTAREGRRPGFPVARMWFDRKDGLPRKAEFLVASGKTARVVSFEAWQEREGRPIPGRLVIVDTLRPGTTTVEYLGAERHPVDDRLFDPAEFRGAGVPGR